jgi:hypothetical protein
MLTNRHVDAYIEEKIPPQQNIRRLANGSIDYTFYDRRAREDRGIAVRAAFHSLITLGRRLADLLPGGRAPRQLQMEKTQAQPRPFLMHQRRETATASRKTYSEAA